MRDRKQIDEQLREQKKGVGIAEKEAIILVVVLEALLDIRDLLEALDSRIDDLQSR